MRANKNILGGAVAFAALALAGCGGGETGPDIDNTVVTDVDPMGSTDDTTVIDATLGSDDDAGMEGAMPADSAEPRPPEPSGDARSGRDPNRDEPSEPDADANDAADEDAAANEAQ